MPSTSTLANDQLRQAVVHRQCHCYWRLLIQRCISGKYYHLSNCPTEDRLLSAGSATAIGSFLYSSAYLASTTASPNSLSPTAAAHNISATVLSAELSPQLQREGFAQAIKQGLQQSAVYTTGVLIAAAVQANDVPAVSKGFALVSIYCSACMLADMQELVLSWFILL